MTSTEIRQRFLDFFAKRGHVVLPSASLVPKDDPTVLFTTAGMQQFKPYYTGEKNPEIDFGSRNAVTVQKCIRTSDIDEVGDDTHLTFFEMLGNFSFGGYWKEEAIRYAYDFITKELGLTIDYVSIFKDDASGIPADEESRQIWQSIDSKLVIKEHSREDNFWGPTGDEGPCGPTTEIYINGVEIWNIVFNEYYKTKEGKFEPLTTKGIDTGMGLERLLVQVQQKNNVYETDVFAPILKKIEESLSLDTLEKIRSARIVADHSKAAGFLIMDGIRPSNSGQGYILRRLIRRGTAHAFKMGVRGTALGVGSAVADTYKDVYRDFVLNSSEIENVFVEERKLFMKTIESGWKEFDKKQDPYILFTTYGFPIELTEELAKEKGWKIDHLDFEEKMKRHQALSRTSSAGMFKGGLASTNEQTTKLHTAHHLLLAALQQVLGKDVKQRGSNITDERLRIDFAFDRKLTDEEKKEVEDIVNRWIKRDFSVIKREMSKEHALTIGAEMEFGTKYPDVVSVYFICPSADAQDGAISAEFCGGPHVERTGTLGHFKIQKEEASSAGIRRIKATLS